MKTSIMMSMMCNRSAPVIPQSLAIDAQDFCEIFPYHIVFDTSMNLKHAGFQIQYIIPEFRQENENVTRHLDLVHPGRCDFSFHNIKKYITCPHVLKTRHNNLTSDYSQKGAIIYFRGQMIELSKRSQMLYLCSPYVHSLSAIENFGMHISDIPTHDVTKYLLQGCSSTEGFKKRTNRGDWLEGFLGSNGQPIFADDLDYGEEEHKFTMVPRGIADQMKAGQRIEGKTYRNCTILFCDLVQFGLIVEKSTPSEVLTMLNDLHEKFDRLAMAHDVFKVDVIGDAYVIVSGIPTPVSNHSERIAKMALAMIQVSKMTMCPYNYGGSIGSRVLSRIGLHSGDVIGGVIGQPVHRFTILGENVVIASRMESHGIPDRIHFSESTYSELKQYKFEIEPRGNVEIRGRGRIFTYLLKDNQNISKEVLFGGHQPNKDIYPLPMSPNHDPMVSFGSPNNSAVRPGTRAARHPRSARKK